MSILQAREKGQGEVKEFIKGLTSQRTQPLAPPHETQTTLFLSGSDIFAWHLRQQMHPWGLHARLLPKERLVTSRSRDLHIPPTRLSEEKRQDAVELSLL